MTTRNRRLTTSWMAVVLASTLLAGCSAPPRVPTGMQEKRISPFAQCRWELVNGIEPLMNSRTTPGFDPAFNPFLTVSRRGLTVRVVGVLSESTLQRFDGSMDRVVEAYPHLTPVHYTARHVVRGEDLNRPVRSRVQNPAGEIVSTEVIELPPNAVMIIYPVSVAAPGFNTAAGNWTMLSKDRERPNDDKGAFGGFPFLKYTFQGHALHGPITGDRARNEWGLRRGAVSHGCNRMEGEHSVELAALLSCPNANGSGGCAFANERVTVMEEFDYFPDPAADPSNTGVIADYSEIYTRWVSPDVAGAPRANGSAIPADRRIGMDTLVLDRTLNKGWSQPASELSSSLSGRPGAGAVRVKLFATWDNRETSVSATPRQFVRGTSCAN